MIPHEKTCGTVKSNPMENQRDILVIDDNSETLELLDDFLSESGYRVRRAETGEKGLAEVAQQLPDLIILDLFLPDLKGSEVCARLRANPKTRSVPVILCTAHQITHEEKIKGFRSGVDDFLIRPFRLDELAARIEAVLRRSAANHVPSEPPPATPAPTPALKPAAAPAPSDPPPTALHLFQRIWEILNEPRQAMRRPSNPSDFVFCILLVLLTPCLASLSRLTQRAPDFDSWIGFLSLDMATNVLMWLSIGAAIHLAMPFYGQPYTWRKALVAAGWGWSGRVLGALFYGMYPLIAQLGYQMGDFSAGINIIPGISPSDGITFLSRISIFDIWAAWITLTAVWSATNEGKRRWDAISIVLGVLCVLLGALTAY